MNIKYINSVDIVKAVAWFSLLKYDNALFHAILDDKIDLVVA